MNPKYKAGDILIHRSEYDPHGDIIFIRVERLISVYEGYYTTIYTTRPNDSSTNYLSLAGRDYKYSPLQFPWDDGYIV